MSKVICTLALNDSTRRRTGDILAPRVGSVRLPLQDALVAFCHAADVGGIDTIVMDSMELAGPDGLPRYHNAPREGLTIARVATAIDEEMAEEPFTRHLSHDDTSVRWDGCFTAGRMVAVTDHGDGTATLRWDSGTGRPSWWLGRAFRFAGIACARSADVARIARRLTPERHGALAGIAQFHGGGRAAIAGRWR